MWTAGYMSFVYVRHIPGFMVDNRAVMPLLPGLDLHGNAPVAKYKI